MCVCVCVCIYIKLSACALLQQASYPLHGILIISQIIQTQGNTGGRHGGTWNIQKLLHSTMSHKLSSKLLVQQQGGQILRWQKYKRALIKAMFGVFLGEANMGVECFLAYTECREFRPS